MKTFHKVLLYGVLPLAAATGIIIWVQKSSKNDEDDGNSPGATSNATDKTAPAVKPVPPQKNPSFPLQQGSNNSYVGKLQKALGLPTDDIDNIFGPQTAQALANAAGISFIKDETQLNNVIAAITTGAATAARARDLYNKDSAGQYSIQGVKTATWMEVSKDIYGAYNSTGKAITIYKGTTYNKNDYRIADYTKGGNVILEINKGDAQGQYLGDPNNITLV